MEQSVDLSAVSILLPAASVAVFSRDPQTLEASRGLAQDWRFARIKVHPIEGDASTAIATFRESASPELVIIQTDTIDDDFTQSLEGLAGVCEEGTSAIVIGPVNDVYLYRRLIDLGISDYLVRPVEPSILAEVIARTLVERLGAAESRLVVFAGAKGGVGTSVLAEASAWTVSDMLGQKTVLLDVSGGWSAVSVGMGFEPSTTLCEAVRAAERRDEDTLRRMMFKASDNLSVLASGGDAMLDETVTPAQCEALLDMLLQKNPVVIVDVSHASPVLARLVLRRANQIFIVSAPTLPSLRLGRSLLQEIRDLRGNNAENIEFIVNMAGFAPTHEVSKTDIEKAMEFKVSTTIAFNPKVIIRCESEARRLTDDRDGKEIARTHLLPLLRKVVPVAGGDGSSSQSGGASKKGFLSGLLGKLGK